MEKKTAVLTVQLSRSSPIFKEFLFNYLLFLYNEKHLTQHINSTVVYRHFLGVISGGHAVKVLKVPKLPQTKVFEKKVKIFDVLGWARSKNHDF